MQIRQHLARADRDGIAFRKTLRISRAEVAHCQFALGHHAVRGAIRRKEGLYLVVVARNLPCDAFRASRMTRQLRVLGQGQVKPPFGAREAPQQRGSASDGQRSQFKFGLRHPVAPRCGFTCITPT